MTTTLKNIVLSTDFSKLADNALSTAVAMCRRQGAKLHVIHVVENRFIMAPTEMYAAAIYVVPELESIAKQKLESLEKSIKAKAIIDLQTHLVFANAADGIRDKAIEIGADLIVMGTHGASGFRNMFLGSTAYNVIKNTTIPVLTVPGNKKITEFNKILFPLRTHKGIADKYEFIAPVIEKNSAELLILGLSKPGESDDMGNVEDEIRIIAKALRSSSINYRSDYKLSRNFAKEVIQTAKKEKVDLIVINASLDYSWRQFFVGPYTQQVLNQSPIPVLSFRTPAAADVLLQEIKNDFSHNPQLKLAM